jgi:hypothetical protein
VNHPTPPPSRRSFRRAALLILVLAAVSALAAPACSSNPDVATGRSLSEACSLTSDCITGLVCALGECRQQCVSNVDCPSGGTCVTDSTGGVCETAKELDTPCQLPTQCAAPLACAADYRCRNLCQSDSDCNVLGVHGRVCAKDPQGVLYCASPSEVNEAGVIDTRPPAGAPDVAVVEPPITVSRGAGAVALSIGARGGTLGIGAVTVTIPPGALDHDILLSITPISPPVTGAIGQAYEIGPTGTQFAQPISIVFAYAVAELGGRSPTEFAVSSVVGNSWHATSPPVLDPFAQTIGGTTMHLSPYALVANVANGLEAPEEAGTEPLDAGTTAEEGGSGGSDGSGSSDANATSSDADATVQSPDGGAPADASLGGFAGDGATCSISASYETVTKVSLTAAWSGTSLVQAGSGPVTLWLLTNYTGSTGTTRICGYQLPPATLTAAGEAAEGMPGTTVQTEVTFPEALWMLSSRTTPVTATVGGTTVGSSFRQAPAVVLDGISASSTLASASTPWPISARGGALASGDISDDDGDKHPGITASPSSSSPYSLPVTANADADGDIAPAAQALYMALRTAIAFVGTSTSCSAGSGQAVVQLLNSAIVGCQLVGGADCDATQTAFLQTNAPQYIPSGPGTYQSLMVPTGTPCLGAQSALP